MKIVAINGSPRKTWNTAKMLESALSGCKDAGAETKLYNLIDLKFKGCTSCFACKRLGGPSYAKCRAPQSMPVKIIFTTNAPFENFHTALNESLTGAMSRFVGPTELIEANDTLQFDDYSKYDVPMFDVEAKYKRHDEVFPLDCQRAYEMGKRAIEEAKKA